MKILVRGPNWLGDAVMTTPALLRLRQRYPEVQIALLTPEKLRDLWRGHPAVNQVISFAPRDSVFAVAAKLRPEQFDLAVVLPNSPRSALETFLARIPKRLGYARAWRNFFLTQTVPTRWETVRMRKRSAKEARELASRIQVAPPRYPPTAHHIHEYLHLVAALEANPEPLPPQLFVSSDEIASVKKNFGLEKITKPIIGLNPGAEYGPAKRWPLEKFIAAANEIQLQTNCAWILFGGKNDRAITDPIESAIRHQAATVVNLAGRTSLRELMALLKLCRVVVTNDTGPMHVAAALNVPVVALFGSTSPELTGPIISNGSPHQILQSNAFCAPCFLRDCPIDFRCMNDLRVETVVAAVWKALQ